MSFHRPGAFVSCSQAYSSHMYFEFQGSYYGICHFSVSFHRWMDGKIVMLNRWMDGWMGKWICWMDGWMEGVRVILMGVNTATSLYIVLDTRYMLY